MDCSGCFTLCQRDLQGACRCLTSLIEVLGLVGGVTYSFDSGISFQSSYSLAVEAYIYPIIPHPKFLLAFLILHVLLFLSPWDRGQLDCKYQHRSALLLASVHPLAFLRAVSLLPTCLPYTSQDRSCHHKDTPLHQTILTLDNALMEIGYRFVSLLATPSCRISAVWHPVIKVL